MFSHCSIHILCANEMAIEGGCLFCGCLELLGQLITSQKGLSSEQVMSSEVNVSHISEVNMWITENKARFSISPDSWAMKVSQKREEAISTPLSSCHNGIGWSCIKKLLDTIIILHFIEMLVKYTIPFEWEFIALLLVCIKFSYVVK